MTRLTSDEKQHRRAKRRDKKLASIVCRLQKRDKMLTSYEAKRMAEEILRQKNTKEKVGPLKYKRPASCAPKSRAGQQPAGDTPEGIATTRER